MPVPTPSIYLLQGAWAFCLAFVLVCLEIVCSGLGWILPAAALAGFYLTNSHDWRLGLVVSCYSTVMVEIVLGRRWTMIPVMFVVIAMGVIWRKHGNRNTAVGQVLPGLAIGLLYGGCVVLAENATFSGWFAISLAHAASQVLKATIAGGLALPVVVALMDWLAERLEMRPYHKRLSSGRDLV